MALAAQVAPAGSVVSVSRSDDTVVVTVSGTVQGPGGLLRWAAGSRGLGERDGAGGAVRPGRGAAAERGAATLLGVALAGVLLLIGVTLAEITAVVAAHRRAQAAADLAALAGATSPGESCAAADRVATANGARLTGCLLEGADVLVSVRVDPPPGLDRVVTIPGQARAGPAP